VANEKRETELVHCEGCQKMIRPLTEHVVSLVGATVVTVHACPTCGPQKVSVKGPFQ
jgi:predicted RNA-binding Zn-ribbon protein involved in translation (DUF1610 family)